MTRRAANPRQVSTDLTRNLRALNTELAAARTEAGEHQEQCQDVADRNDRLCRRVDDHSESAAAHHIEAAIAAMRAAQDTYHRAATRAREAADNVRAQTIIDQLAAADDHLDEVIAAIRHRTHGVLYTPRPVAGEPYTATVELDEAKFGVWLINSTPATRADMLNAVSDLVTAARGVRTAIKTRRRLFAGIDKQIRAAERALDAHDEAVEDLRSAARTLLDPPSDHDNT